MIAADVKAPLLPSQEAALLLPQAGRSSAANQVIPISRSEPVLYLQRAAIICLNPSLRAAAVLSLDSGVSLSPRPTAATRGLEQKPACSPAGTAGWRFASRGGGFGGRFGCPSALQLVQRRAALCACAVRALSSEGRSQRGCFLGITSTSARARALPTRSLLHVTWTQLLSPLVCRQPPPTRFFSARWP